MAKPSTSLPRPAPPPSKETGNPFFREPAVSAGMDPATEVRGSVVAPAEEVYPPVAPLPRPWREPSPTSAARIPLSYAAFGPGVTAGGKTFEEARAEWRGCEDLAYDVALGCVTLGPHMVPLANVRAMVRAGSGT